MSTDHGQGSPLNPQNKTRPPTPPTPSGTPKIISRFSSTTSTRTPSTRTHSPDSPQSTHSYAPDASIVLIGMRGSGMSTLAVLASSTLGFRVLDADQHFYKVTGLSRAAYKAAHGIPQYRQEELRLMKSMLFGNPKGAVIVCGPGAVEGKGKEWLFEYAKDHLIIYILREAEEIQKHLRIFDVDTIRDLTRRAAPAYRSLSSFEFYNVSDTLLRKPDATSVGGDLSPWALTLKNVEEDFLHLIHSITGRDDSYDKYKAKHSLSSVPLESRSYTYALSIPLSTLSTIVSEFQGVDVEADAVELTIPISSLWSDGHGVGDTKADQISRQVFIIRRNIRLPILYNIDTSWEGQRAIDQDEYFGLLHHGLRLAPEYLCVDLRSDTAKIQSLVASKGRTKIIAHYVVSNPAEDGWDTPKLWSMVQLAQNLGCDILRINQEAWCLEDNFAAQYFVHRVKSSQNLSIPLIAFNTGKHARISCYLNSILTPVTHPLVRKLVPECPSSSLLTVQEAQKAAFASFLLDGQYFGIYGNNTSQSLSPAMHNAAFELLGMPHRYNVFLHESMDELHDMIKDPNFGGASITAPFKTAIIPKLDFLSDEAKAIGAANTLLCLKSPSIDSLLDRNTAGPTVALFGENTDWIGIHTCVQRNLSPINAVRRRTTGLIVGAGGMARAAAYALIRLGVKTILIQNRTRSRAEELIKQFEDHKSGENGQDEILSRGMQRDSETPDPILGPVFRIVDSKDDPLPEDVNPPTIVISCIPTKDINGTCSVDTSLPDNWLSSPTGGVVIEVRVDSCRRPSGSAGTRNDAIRVIYKSPHHKMVADNKSPSNEGLDARESSTTIAAACTTDMLPRQTEPTAEKQFFIFGHNIAHSLSPALHNAGFKALNLQHHYQIHESENVDETVEQIIHRPNFGGASVTFPHKLQIGRLLDSISPRGESIGAINTVVVHESNGRKTLHGDNTDWIGIKRCIIKSGHRNFAASSAVVLGAGGAARAACYAIQALGFKDLIVINRTLSKAQELASRFTDLKSRAVSTLEEADALKDANIRLVVACVPADDLGEDKIPSGLFSKTGDGVLVEMAYRPQVTGMMIVAARYPEWKVYRGVDVLEEQAYAQFELWTGQQAPAEVMRDAMQRKIRGNI
ncbi:type I 3-dehydroquinase-domain-containing protein [Fusarium tricinctum]|uniref:Type I 3-dehydroquinase-domain-containing protein n=1 Tax=Fusarium tricinctum TaxID=61284 RepID=A0A8K0RYU5_9HYPO|nr:type I 3-dehydroquinase-domain-containing protein [Fusarium tricinctum]